LRQPLLNPHQLDANITEFSNYYVHIGLRGVSHTKTPGICFMMAIQATWKNNPIFTDCYVKLLMISEIEAATITHMNCHCCLIRSLDAPL